MSKSYQEYSFSQIKKFIDRGLILLVTATEIEDKNLKEKLLPLDGEELVLEVRKDNATYYIGKFGNFAVAHVKCGDMGSVSSMGSIITINNAINHIKPKFVLMIGIAFGVNPEKQNIGDVLVSKTIMPYESQRIGEINNIYRGPKPEASNNLRDCFNNANNWNFELPNGDKAKKEICDILSGEKLIDDIDYRENLRRDFPTAKGGEMEGAGLYAACQDKSVPWILVKGICDFADGNKNEGKDEKQKIAMQSALSLCLNVFGKKYVFESFGIEKFEKKKVSELSIIPKKIDDPKDNFIIHFSQEYSEFTGRDEEIAVLKDFLKSEKKFSWSCVTGQGGIGKSRLLLEFCKQMQPEGWLTWFGSDHTELFENPFYFDDNMLIIIDDKTLEIEDIGNFIQRINSVTKKHKTRVVFINRTNPENYEKLKKADPNFQNDLFESPLLELKGFSQKDFNNFVKKIVLKRNEQFDIIKLNSINTTQIDPFKRPIFGVLLGLAIAEGRDISNWVEKDILEYFYSTEYLKLEKYCNGNKPLLEKHLNLVAVLLIYKFPSHQDIRELVKIGKDWLPNANEFQQSFLQNFFVKEEGNHRWQSLYPDIIATFFILERLKEIDKNVLYGFDEIKAIIDYINSRPWLNKVEKQGDFEITSINKEDPTLICFSNLQFQILQDFPENPLGFKLLTSFSENNRISDSHNGLLASVIFKIISRIDFLDFEKLKAYGQIIEEFCKGKEGFHPIKIDLLKYKFYLIQKGYNVNKNYLDLESATEEFRKNPETNIYIINSFSRNFNIDTQNFLLPKFDTDYANLPIIEEIPYTESLALVEIILNKHQIEKSEIDLFKRLESLNKDWSDPRIKRSLLITVLNSNIIEDKNKVIEKIKSILSDLVKTPPQQDHVNKEKVIFESIIIALDYLIKKNLIIALEPIYRIGFDYINKLNGNNLSHRDAVKHFMFKTKQLLIDKLYIEGYKRESEVFLKFNQMLASRFQNKAEVAAFITQPQ